VDTTLTRNPFGINPAHTTHWGIRTNAVRILAALASLLVALLLVPTPASAESAPPPDQPVKLMKGINYEVVNTDVEPPKDGKILVQEFFWYGCPHCFHFESALEPWVKRLPSDIVFQRVAYPLGPHWVPLCRAFYAAKYMGIVPQTHTEIFNDIHVKHMRPVTKGQIADMYADLGVDRQKFLSMYDSFAVDNAVRHAQAIGKQADITGVPSVLVDGKYMTSGNMAGSNKGMLGIIDALITKIRAQKATAHAGDK